MAANSLLLLLSLSLTIFFVPTSLAADADPLQDFCVADLHSPVVVNGFPCKPNFTVVSDDFFSSAISVAGDTNNMFGSSITPANVLSFPGLNTLGLSMNRVDIAPGGVNPPHVHPHATQLGFVVEGKVLVGFVTTAGVFYSKVLGPGMNFIIPRGLMHFELNIGEGKALEITAFNSQLPGTVVSSVTLFGSKPPIPDAVLSRTFQVDNQIIDLIKSKFGN
ncbi:germin-like protein 3-8 [Ananas comosus]|uniref:Germin-like protein n=1 Tax=Ananas comosus TaxID=4615 RepID=A0A6P5FI89_ANACO|nr:germin-like protein 3-8 [Ananas comosus]